MKYRISVLQYEPIFLKPMQNHEVLSDLLSNIVTDLVVLPELAYTNTSFIRSGLPVHVFRYCR